MIIIHSNIVKVEKDLFRSSVLLNLSFSIETNHVTSSKGSSTFECFFKTFFLDQSLSSIIDSNDKVDGSISMIFFVILDEMKRQ